MRWGVCGQHVDGDNQQACEAKGGLNSAATVAAAAAAAAAATAAGGGTVMGLKMGR
jgi:hypothetical protein